MFIINKHFRFLQIRLYKVRDGCSYYDLSLSYDGTWRIYGLQVFKEAGQNLENYCVINDDGSVITEIYRDKIHNYYDKIDDGIPIITRVLYKIIPYPFDNYQVDSYDGKVTLRVYLREILKSIYENVKSNDIQQLLSGNANLSRQIWNLGCDEFTFVFERTPHNQINLIDLDKQLLDCKEYAKRKLLQWTQKYYVYFHKRTKKEFRKWQLSLHKETNEFDTCLICLEDTTKFVYFSPCGHKICKECFNHQHVWICPICRATW